MTEMNEIALHAKHKARPSTAVSTPPSAPPNTRARLTDTELSVTAFGRSSGGTISEMKLCLAGLSNTFTNPSDSASTYTSHISMTWVPVKMAKIAASTPDSVWVTYRIRRLL